MDGWMNINTNACECMRKGERNGRWGDNNNKRLGSGPAKQQEAARGRGSRRRRARLQGVRASASVPAWPMLSTLVWERSAAGTLAQKVEEKRKANALRRRNRWWAESAVGRRTALRCHSALPAR
jgi:hypothetical protein